MKIVLYGITADPPTMAHYYIMDAAMKFTSAHIGFVQPASKPGYRENSISAFKHRYNMAKLLFEDSETGIINTIISDFEPFSQKTYTVDTLEFLTKHFQGAQIILVIGLDEYNKFWTWHKPFEILAMADILIVERNGSEPVSKIVTDRLGKIGKIALLEVPKAMDISSTQARRDLFHKNSTSMSLDTKVRQYAIDNKLYIEE
jgi:nicotinate-nucleotide adenylyltransferase